MGYSAGIDIAYLGQEMQQKPLKVVVYLCEEHGKKVAPKMPMTDDVLICQVPTCFGLATWKYFTDVRESAASLNTEEAEP